MLLSAPLLFLAAQAASAEPAVPEPYPAREVLAAFATACSGIEDIAVARASVLAAGWEEFTPDAASAIGRIVNIGALLATEEEPELGMLSGGTFRKQVAGRELFSVISGVEMDTIGSYGCRVYDLSAPAALSAETLEEWAVRAPQPVAIGIPGGVKYVWNPGLKPGHMEMEVSFMPHGAKLPEPLAGIPLSGLVLTASALEFLDL